MARSSAARRLTCVAPRRSGPRRVCPSAQDDHCVTYIYAIPYVYAVYNIWLTPRVATRDVTVYMLRDRIRERALLARRFQRRARTSTGAPRRARTA